MSNSSPHRSHNSSIAVSPDLQFPQISHVITPAVYKKLHPAAVLPPLWLQDADLRARFQASRDVSTGSLIDSKGLYGNNRTTRLL
jgi:hypothetical protein